MPFHFCPQCGIKLQPAFRFCPSCGEGLPGSSDESGSGGTGSSLSVAPTEVNEAATSVVKTTLTSVICYKPMESKNTYEGLGTTTSTPVTPRPALRKTSNSLRLERGVKFNIKDVAPSVLRSTNLVPDGRIQRTPPKQHTVTVHRDEAVPPTLESSSPPVRRSPRPVKGKAKLCSPAKKLVEEGKKLTEKTNKKAEEPVVDSTTLAATSSPVSSPVSRSPLKGKTRAKRAKLLPAVEPLQDGEEVTDTTSNKWKLVKLLSQSATALVYEILQTTSKESNHILKLGAKDGRIFNEQNLLQRAAKPASVDKWIKQNKMDFLGIPSCVGFGLHADSYRFLIFPNMGQSLQSLMEEGNELLSEKAVLQLACRILDVLQYIHSNEYVHADISAENIYIKQGETSQVYLAGYCHAFRFCPGGQHVEYREDSRTPHEGTIELISLDTHKGAAPSRRSDLQSLGYCMLRWHTGSLPWTALNQPDQVAAGKQRYMEDVPALLSHCFGKKRVSSALQTYLTTAMALHYAEQPDYSALKAGLSATLQELGGSLDQPFSF